MPYKDPVKRKEHSRLYNQTWYKKNKVKVCDRTKKRKKDLLVWITDLKSTLKCEKCGESHIATLDFHHTKDKDISISQAVGDGWSKERILKEIKKCVVLCSNCHRKLHWKKKHKKK